MNKTSEIMLAFLATIAIAGLGYVVVTHHRNVSAIGLAPPPPMYRPQLPPQQQPVPQQQVAPNQAAQIMNGIGSVASAIGPILGNFFGN